MAKRVALVTGGTGGIGTEICKELHRQDRAVVAGYLPMEEAQALAWQKQLLTEGYDIKLAAGDVSDYDSAAVMVGEITEKYGKIEILVNCAGITRDSLLKKMELKNWLAVINTNLNSVFNVTRQVIEDMMTDGFGRIVNISSVNGQRGQFGQTNYSAAKAGIHGFTKALALEGARKGVTVNTVAPGYVETHMTKVMKKEILNSIIQTIPMGRLAYACEIAKAVGFLCQDDSAYITGAEIPVNGGMYMS